MTTYTPPNLAYYTENRSLAHAEGDTARVYIHISALEHPDTAGWATICTICPTDAVLAIAVVQEYLGHDGQYRTPDSTDDYLCQNCAGLHAPGLLGAVRDLDTAEHRIRTWRDNNDARLYRAARDSVAKTLPPMLRTLGFDGPTITEAITALPTTIILSVKMTSHRVIGPNVPGGEIVFMADDDPNAGR